MLGQEAQECFNGDQDCQDCSCQDCPSKVSQDWRFKLTSDQVFIRMDKSLPMGTGYQMVMFRSTTRPSCLMIGYLKIFLDDFRMSLYGY